jgi:tetratricopeptide (TPR) repeat protein
VPIDRVATLRNAEKLLRQGKLDQAIAEYVRVVEDQPRDWNTANTLGDLYVRGAQIDKAVEQFVRIADHLYGEGFFPKAGALYKKVLKIKPDHEHSLLQSAEVAVQQGLLLEARQALAAVGERRSARGDAAGVAKIRIRLGALDPDDVEARLDAARARRDVGDSLAALNELKQLAVELTEKGREADAIEAIREAAQIDPHDAELRERLLAIYISAGDFESARECAATVEQFKAIAAALEERGYSDHALAALVEASHLDPSDTALRERLARAFVAKGDLESASGFLTVETAGADHDLRLMLGGIRLRSGDVDEGVAVLKQLLEEDPTCREAIALLGWNLAEQDAEAGYPAVALAADAAVAQSDFAGAAAALQEFVTRVPNHIPALMRLVEICVDGGLEATMFSAQAHLADAYIASGAAAEARFIAEDLVAREPWERANVERFRQALVLLGESDPDSVIADRLSGQSPFTTTDLSIGEITEFSDFEEAPVAVPPAAAESSPVGAPPAALAPPPVVAAAPPRAAEPAASVKPLAVRVEPPEPKVFELSEEAIDLDGALGDLEEPAGETERIAGDDETSEDGEIDLSVALDDPASVIEAEEIDGVLEKLRDQPARRPRGTADVDYERALALREVGELDEAVGALESAARSPKVRFKAATLLGRIYRQRNALPKAIEWFERAAEASAPTETDSHLLLYELADVLESSGEFARALAVCLELQAEVGEFKDLSARIDRLAKVQTRG